jgi:hypothetical protein
MRARWWAAAGRELDRCDPRRHNALLLLAEAIVREHRKSDALSIKSSSNLKSKIRRRFARR